MKPAVILDWAGTTVDFGCLAPVVVLEEIFADHGVPLGRREARHAMGLLKRDQIREITRLGRVRAAWTQAHGAPPGEPEIDALFASFIPRQLEVIERYSAVMDGVADFAYACRRRGLKIGSTTGYTRPMLDVVLARAAREGFVPDAHVTPDETGGRGRPAPWMIFRNLELLDVYPPTACIKIGDTASDIAEGRNAGLWTIGLSTCGNEVGLSQAEYLALPVAERAALTLEAEETLRRAGAHFVCERLLDTLPFIDDILDGIA